MTAPLSDLALLTDTSNTMHRLFRFKRRFVVHSFVVTSFLLFVWKNTPDHYIGEETDVVSANEILLRHEREADEDCSWNLTVGSEGGTLKSPGYPERYPGNSDCRWLLVAPDPNATIVLKMDTFELEPHTECELDYLQVYMGPSALGPSLGPFCGSLSGKTVTTNSSKVLLLFHSDPSYEDKGFSIDYYTQTNGGCVKEVGGSSGVVTSPRFPDTYPDGSDCWTQITVPSGKVIMLQFDVLDLEFDDNCTYDYLKIYDGSTIESNLLGQLCTISGIQGSIVSSSNTLRLHFHSDHLVNRKGFKARYSAVVPEHIDHVDDIGGCQWESEERNGTVASPNFPQKYPGNSNCSLWLRAPPGHVVALHFDAMQLEVETNCSYDFLQLTEGPDLDSKEIGTFCGRLNETKEVVSTGNEIRLIFISDDFAEFSGFKARYEFLKPVNESEVNDEAQVIPSTKEELKFVTVPQNQTLSLGDSFLLSCSTDHPMAKIRWLKDEKFLGAYSLLPGLKMMFNHSLWIQNMSQDLSGVYTCAAVIAEKTIFTKAWISVEDKTPEDNTCNIVFRKKPRDSYFAEGEFAHLECLAAGHMVEMSWEKDGVPLDKKKHITVLRNGFLFLDRITLDDAGLYTCIAHDRGAECRKAVTARLSVSQRARIEDICGIPKVAQPSKEKPIMDHGKIVGGHNTKKGAYPWQVMLWEPTLKSFCGATLLNERWIATAAHCFVNYNSLRSDQVVIKLGKHDRENQEPEEFTTGIADPSSVIIHPAYSKTTFDNDLALVRLRDHVRFTDSILPACVGDVSLDATPLQMGAVVGWGKLKERGPSPRFLQEIRLPVVDQKTCINSTTYMVSRNMFCAGYSQEILGDACSGDSGGPFLIEKEGKWYLAGIVSWGEGCGKSNKYGFYTRVPNYLHWINGIIKS